MFQKFLLLTLILLLFALPVAAQDTLVSLGSTEELGEFLVGPDGMTLYMYPRDPLDESVCVDACLERWPALLVESADEITVAEGIPGEFTTVERPNGSLQVAYNGMPLYYWQNDEAPGDTTGHGVGRVWWVVPPATVYAFRHGDMPPMLVGPTGMTLYLFTNDEMGESTCYDQCAENWPPLTVESEEDFVPGVLLQGEFGFTERTDGTLQVTYNGMPLYYYVEDTQRGDTNGEGRGDVWFTVAPELVALSSSEDLGDFLVSNDGMTLYLFSNDEAGVSNCVDDCAQNWPPLTAPANEPLVASEGIDGELSLIERPDGRMQVAYNGMPLYFFAEDEAPGDTNGQARGDVWWVVEP